jgi:hypothetical protein
MTFEQASFEDPDLKDLGPIKDKNGVLLYIDSHILIL